jgi:3-phosphoshikimate 1-carboxyvinyltransferase
MQAVINPCYIKGTITAPASKSMMQRACAAALLHKGKTTIYHPGHSNDDKAALQIIQQLGATVTIHANDTIEILSKGIAPVSDFIDCGESGLSARLFTPIASLSKQPITIQGHGSLLKRSMQAFGHVLPHLGVTLPDFNGHLPFTVQGPIQTQDTAVDGSGGSQFLSGLLFAICDVATQPVTIEVSNLKSKPYIDLTLEVLDHFGRTVTHHNYHTFYIEPSSFTHTPHIAVTIEGDWSSAAYWLVIGAIQGGITIKGLNLESAQADRDLLQILQDANANMTCTDDGIQMRSSNLIAFECDATHCPDLFPVLAILAACCEGESYIYGLHRLFDKESNRVESIAELLLQFEVPFSMEDDMLCVTGIAQLERATIESYNDHRIVMAAAIGALRANGAVVINDAEVVNKSYPDFFKHLNSMGAQCSFKTD